jgi:ATP-dependent RNA helicase DDX23/PRP28
MIDYNLEESVNFILDQIPETIMKADSETEVIDQEKQMQVGLRNFKTMHMFSATMEPLVEKMARQYLKFPAMVQIGEPGGSKKDIEQRIEFVANESQRKQRLIQLLNRYPKAPIIIFVNLKLEVDQITEMLQKQGKLVTALHGGKSQDIREKSLNSIRYGHSDILVCTNVAARGIDIENVAHVINYGAP